MSFIPSPIELTTLAPFYINCNVHTHFFRAYKNTLLLSPNLTLFLLESPKSNVEPDSEKHLIMFV